MENTALILGSVSNSYSGVLLSLSALSGCSLFFALRRKRKNGMNGAAALCVLGLLLSVPFCRFLHWYSNSSQYPSFLSALTDYRSGGFVVLGAFGAFLLSALLVKALGLVRDLPALLDDLAPAGALALAVGKLSCRFSQICRSKFSFESEKLRRLPFMISSTLSNGAEEWRIATFCLQSLAYLFICGFALWLRKRKKRAGDIFALTLSLMAAVQVVLDSTRYDAAYFRSNGFVSITQVFCVAALLAVLVVFSVRSVKSYGGVKRRHLLCWLLWAVCAGVGGYCEYYVQRHAGAFLPTYAVMESCFLGCFAVNRVMCNSFVHRLASPLGAMSST